LAVLDKSEQVGAGVVTNLEVPGRSLWRRGRWLLALCDLAPRWGKRGIPASKPVPVGLTASEHSGQDGSKDDQEGQSDDRESVHGGEDLGERGGTLGRTDWGAIGLISEVGGAHTMGRFGANWNLRKRDILVFSI